ncbi:MAG: lactonase family protein [Opitutaceae bacterium]
MHFFISAPSLALIFLLTAANCFAEVFDVYFGTSGPDGIHHATFDNTTGKLSTINKVADATNAGFIAIHPSQQFLFSTSATDKRKLKGAVVAFEINPDRSLTKLNQQSSEGFNPCHLSLDATGNTLMVANYASNASVAAFKINQNGSLEASQSIHTHEGSGEHPKRQKGPHPHSIFSNPSNTFAYSPDLGTDTVEIYKLDAQNAQLTPSSSAEVPGGARGPRHMKFSHDGRFAYVLNELTMEVASYSANETTGSLSYIETISTLKDRSDIQSISCAEIRMHPNGKFVYSSNRDLLNQGRDAISVFSRNPDSGLLTLIQNENARVNVPRNFNITPCGKWLIAGGQKTNNLAIFKLDDQTGLIEAHGETIPFTGSPICIEFLK